MRTRRWLPSWVRSVLLLGSGAAAIVVTLVAGLVLGGSPASADSGTFSNLSPISVTDRACPVGSPPGVATAYPSTISVAGLAGNTSKVTVSLKGASHAFPGDWDVLLVSPTGQNLKLVSDAGGQPTTNVTVNFDDAAAGTLPFGGAGSTWGAANSTVSSRPVDYDEPGFPDVFPSPAPAVTASPAPTGTGTLGVFDGVSPNGTWKLYVVDDACGDAGSFGGGWSLTVTTNTAATSSTALTSSQNPALTGQPVTFTATT